VLSAARSLAFNAVLARRVATGSWNRLLPGEVVSLAGSASVFATEQVDEELERRCAAADLHPSGPLCGAGGLQPRDEAAAVEQAALQALAGLPEALTGAGLRGERRALRLCPQAFSYQQTADVLELAFELPRGCFATALLREFAATDAAIGEED
jgi:tRNA pseudouridine13 synthase